MTTDRDALAALIMRGRAPGEALSSVEIADAIRAAGWRAPARFIITIEELDALGEGAVILSARVGVAGRKYGNWYSMGSDQPMAMNASVLPAMVIVEAGQ